MIYMKKHEEFLKRVNLANQQRRINRMFEEEGLTDEVLKKQVEVNTQRHELDLNDSDEVVYVDDDGNVFVQ